MVEREVPMQQDHRIEHCKAAVHGFQVALVALATAGPLVASAQGPAAQAFRPVTDAMLKDPPAADWLSCVGKRSTDPCNRESVPRI